MSSQNPTQKDNPERRTNGERRSTAEKRRAHDRFSLSKKPSERRQNDRRDDRS